jgi:hypothetical protein
MWFKRKNACFAIVKLWVQTPIPLGKKKKKRKKMPLTSNNDNQIFS